MKLVGRSRTNRMGVPPYLTSFFVKLLHLVNARGLGIGQVYKMGTAK